MMPNYITNIYVYCPAKLLISDFMHLVKSFNFALLTTGPTHKLGHTLDLVLSSGFANCNVDTILIFLYTALTLRKLFKCQ